MSTPATTTGSETQSTPPAAPSHLRWIMDRAAMKFIARGNPAQVRFKFDAGTGTQAFLARPHWRDGENAPRLTVYSARTGDYVCCSLQADWFTPDPEPSLWNLDYDVDAAQLFGAPSRE